MWRRNGMFSKQAGVLESGFRWLVIEQFSTKARSVTQISVRRTIQWGDWETWELHRGHVLLTIRELSCMVPWENAVLTVGLGAAGVYVSLVVVHEKGAVCTAGICRIQFRAKTLRKLTSGPGQRGTNWHFLVFYCCNLCLDCQCNRFLLNWHSSSSLCWKPIIQNSKSPFRGGCVVAVVHMGRFGLGSPAGIRCTAASCLLQISEIGHLDFYHFWQPCHTTKIIRNYVSA